MPKAHISIEAELVPLDNLGLAELRGLWVERLGKPPLIASTEVTRRWLAWEIQAKRLGGFDAATRRQLRHLVRSKKPACANVPSETAQKPGMILVREWAGIVHRVTILEDGFLWNSRTWKSLSEIANRITGTRWSGPRFFGLKRGGI